MRKLSILSALFAVSLSFACSSSVGTSGDRVGGPCTSSADCASGSACLNGGDFPGGTCATTCAQPNDCPSGSTCVKKEGGVCLLSCDMPSDCRSGYTCKGASNITGGGESLVCID